MEPTPSQCHLCNEIHSLKYFVAHVNGHYEGTCVNTKLWSLLWNMIWITSWRVGTIMWRISFILYCNKSFIIVEHGINHIDVRVGTIMWRISFIPYCNQSFIIVGTWYESSSLDFISSRICHGSINM